MTSHQDDEKGTDVLSTTSDWRWRKIKRRPQGTDTVRAKRGRWWGLCTWPRRRELRISVTWRGGPESWWLVKARGRHGVFPGHAALEDVMASVLNEWNGPVLTDSRDSDRAARTGTFHSSVSAEAQEDLRSL